MAAVGVNSAKWQKLLNRKHVQEKAPFDRLILFVSSQISSCSGNDAIGAAVAGMRGQAADSTATAIKVRV